MTQVSVSNAGVKVINQKIKNVQAASQALNDVKIAILEIAAADNQATMKLNEITGRLTGAIQELLRWSSRLSVGVTEFDNQHRNMIEMINTLHAAMKSGKEQV